MAIYDIDGNELSLDSSFDSAITMTPVDVGGGEIVPFNGDGTYYRNPFIADTTSYYLWLYDANKNPLAIYDSNDNVVNRMDLSGQWPLQYRYTVSFEGTTIILKLYLNYESLVNNVPRNTLYYHVNSVPVYMKADTRITYNMYSDEELPTGLYLVHYDDTKYVGFFDQIDDYVQGKAGDSILYKNTEFGKKMVQETVYQINQTRDAIRVGTFNAYCAGLDQENWECIKNELEDFGLDLCAFQEVRDPLNTVGTNKVWADEMTGWQFPYASTNGTLYPTNERVCLSRYPIVSSSEYEFDEWSSDKRCLAKYEIQLPPHQDRVGSEQLKMSVYNTQLEVATTRNPETGYANPSNVRKSEAQEILDDIAVDKNRFIVVCMDSNDFSHDKEIWQMFEDAGFTRCIDARSQTTRDQNDIIDQIFVNENMTPLNCDVINSKRYMFMRPSGSVVAVSDHDLCFADIQLEYDSFYIVKQTLTHVTSDFSDVTVDANGSLTIHFTADSGYSITDAKVRMGGDWEHTMYYSNGTLNIPEVTGDVNIIITATENS